MMIANVFSFISFLLFLVCLGYLIASLVSPKKLKVPLPLFLGIGVFLAALCLFIPANLARFEGSDLTVMKTVFVSIYNTIALFTANSDYAAIFDYSATLTNDVLQNFYRVLGSIAYLIAPTITFGIVLSFFRNAKARFAYFFSFNKNVYVFTELNDKTILLAEDIREKEKHAAIVFTDINEDNASLYERADYIKCILFKASLQSLSFKRHAKNKKIYIFVFNENDDEAVTLFEAAYQKLKDYPNASIYFRSVSAQGKLVFTHNDDHAVKTFRVDYDVLFVYQFLRDRGFELFDHAKESGGRKVISVLICGLGRYGKQLLKALCWYCQMDGYYLKITGVDKDPDILAKLQSEAPELFDEHNGKEVPGDAQYEIVIHGGMALHTASFDAMVLDLKDCTDAFACLGQDEGNVDAAMELRMLFVRAGIHPYVRAIVSGEKSDLFADATNYRGVPYEIDCLGDYKSVYSLETLLHSDLEAKALALHRQYKKEEEFWKYEYNYRSSLATAIHLEAKAHCKIPGAGEDLASLDDKTKEALENLEHRRWNAFMRGEGYVYTQNEDKTATSLGKMHYDLVPYASLSEEDKRKDSLMSTKTDKVD